MQMKFFKYYIFKHFLQPQSSLGRATMSNAYVGPGEDRQVNDYSAVR